MMEGRLALVTVEDQHLGTQAIPACAANASASTGPAVAQGRRMGTMTARLLPPEEWAAKLQGTPLHASVLDPASSWVFVVEQDGVVIGHLAAMNTMHLEGLWIAPDHQGHAGVAKALMRVVVEALVGAGVEGVLSQATDSTMEATLERVGGKRVPGSTWFLSLLKEH